MNIEEVQAALAEKIEGIRRQTLTLDIPEYEDVKRTFQVLLNTIEERDRDVLILQQHISQMAQSMTEDQNRIQLLHERIELQEEKLRNLEEGPGKVDVDVGVLMRQSSRVHMSRVASPGDQYGALFDREPLMDPELEVSLNNSVVVAEFEQDADKFDTPDSPSKSGDETIASGPAPIDGESMDVRNAAFEQMMDQVRELELRYRHLLDGFSSASEVIRAEVESKMTTKVEALRDEMRSEVSALRTTIPMPIPEVATVVPETVFHMNEEIKGHQGHFHPVHDSSQADTLRKAGDLMDPSSADIRSANGSTADPPQEDTNQHERLRRQAMIALVRRDLDAARSTFASLTANIPENFAGFMTRYHSCSRTLQDLRTSRKSLELAYFVDGLTVDEEVDDLLSALEIMGSSFDERLNNLLKEFKGDFPQTTAAEESFAVTNLHDKLSSLEARHNALLTMLDGRIDKVEASLIDEIDLKSKIIASLKNNIPDAQSNASLRREDFNTQLVWRAIQPQVMTVISAEVENLRTEIINWKDDQKPSSPSAEENSREFSGIFRKETNDFDDEADISNLTKEVKSLKYELKNMSSTISTLKSQIKKAMDVALSRTTGSVPLDSSNESEKSNATPTRRKSIQRSTSLLGYADYGNSPSSKHGQEDITHSGPSRNSNAAGIATGLGVANMHGSTPSDNDSQHHVEQELARISSAIQTLTVPSIYLCK